MELPTLKYVDLSTAHIAREDSELLRERKFADYVPMAVYENEYGYFIPVPDGPEAPVEMRDSGFSREFVDLIEACQQQGISLIRLDCDAPEIAGLPQFDW